MVIIYLLFTHLSFLPILDRMQARVAALMQEDEENNAMPGNGAFAASIAPLRITPQVIQQISELPVSDDDFLSSSIWFVHCFTEQEYTGTSTTCTVYTVTKEIGSNGAILHDSDGLGMNRAMSAVLDP